MPKRSAMSCWRLAWRRLRRGALWPHTAGGGPRAAAGRWRVTHHRRADPYDTRATNRLTRGPAWTCWVIPQDPVCPAHPPCRLRRAHHQYADRGHARDADLDHNRPPPPVRPKNASSRARAGGEGASAYVTVVRTTAASRCRRIAWHEVAGSTPRL